MENNTYFYLIQKSEPINYVYHYQAGRNLLWREFLGEQSFKRRMISDRGTTSEVLAYKSYNLAAWIVILRHQSNIAVIHFPKIHLFFVVGIYMDNLQLTPTQILLLTTMQKHGDINFIKITSLTVLLGSYNAWAAASMLSNSSEVLSPTSTTCLREGTRSMSAAQHIKGTAIAVSFNLFSKTACNTV
jgi:hypothetical protein